MYLRYFLFQLWHGVVDHVLPLLALLIIALLVPRLGRLAIRIIESRLDSDAEATKARLALAGALVYILQAVVYFLLIVAALANLGVPPLGAALPATVVSAAVGFGAQSIIGDFLAGFFILSEKQFGVGDYVSFDGASGVEGTVVALTLRTTKVRTPSGEVVTIPNGSAGVITNFSQDWARAVVDLAVPVREGESVADVSKRVESVAERAIREPSIAQDVAGDLEVLPATGLIAPTVAGQPWQVNYRVLVVVNPARQWAVERAIRSALLSSFWGHYNVPQDHLLFERPDDDELRAPARQEAAEPRPVEAKRAEAERAEAETEVSSAVSEAAEASVLDGVSTSEDEAEGEEAAQALGEAAPTGWQKITTFGGRTRSSTFWLVLGLIVTGLLVLASRNPEEGSAGWLSPEYWRGGKSETQSTQSVPPSSPAPQTAEQQTHEPVDTPTATSSPEPQMQPEATGTNRHRDADDEPTRMRPTETENGQSLDTLSPNSPAPTPSQGTGAGAAATAENAPSAQNS